MLKHHGNILKIDVGSLRGRFSMKGSNTSHGKWDQLNNSYELECDKNSKLQYNVGVLEKEVKTLRVMLQKNENNENNIDGDNNPKTSKLQKRIKRLQSEINKLRGVLNEKEKTENGLVDAMIELDEQKDTWKKKFQQSEKLLEGCKINISELKYDIRQLNMDNGHFEKAIEKKNFQILKDKEILDRLMRRKSRTLTEDNTCQTIVSPFIQKDYLTNNSTKNIISKSRIPIRIHVPYSATPSEVKGYQ